MSRNSLPRHPRPFLFLSYKPANPRSPRLITAILQICLMLPPHCNVNIRRHPPPPPRLCLYMNPASLLGQTPNRRTHASYHIQPSFHCPRIKEIKNQQQNCYVKTKITSHSHLWYLKPQVTNLIGSHTMSLLRGVLGRRFRGMAPSTELGPDSDAA